MMDTNETFVYGREPSTARALLDAARALGLPEHVVRAREAGFVVPDAVWDEAARVMSAPAAEAVF